MIFCYFSHSPLYQLHAITLLLLMGRYLMQFRNENQKQVYHRTFSTQYRLLLSTIWYRLLCFVSIVIAESLFYGDNTMTEHFKAWHVLKGIMRLVIFLYVSWGDVSFMKGVHYVCIETSPHWLG